MPTQQWPDTFDPSPPQSPAPVAGAVEEIKRLVDQALNSRGNAVASRGDQTFSWAKSNADREAVFVAIEALRSQPAPAVAVEAERELQKAARSHIKAIVSADFEFTMGRITHETRYRPIEDFEKWLFPLLAARSAPAVAEKVPLTEEQIQGAWAASSDPNSAEMSIFEFARAIERAHGIGSGSAQEGQAK